ncbi:1-acyl-sn-glycerol-3-phosphate acyltransferase 1, chloroplastic isoform X2 [Amborella trichopoda]|uniref:1-acyl-sn-glycerol-3-phosphate acyltransferase 1, chloroplastic isoform X2 n=1 Tax=Amborella trichopoda TaxID=13333 RepID=UPI0009BEB9F0|nr:1-acyl-sn-glycerol-3-phosphate acyltransferase 1, chloroplastic isoform X2 [Amborella trichopoda]|eukprot:XP_020524247.1 1-acyl-sn-glycerol-3-phosphate acyltransferase 1, chloroplastic isoform X2 [Amborella trichopoda]
MDAITTFNSPVSLSLSHSKLRTVAANCRCLSLHSSPSFNGVQMKCTSHHRNAFHGSGYLFKRVEDCKLYLTHGRKQPKRTIVRSELTGTGSPNAANSLTVTDVSFSPKVRGIFFYTITGIVAITLFLVMLVVHPFVYLFDRHRRSAHHLIAKIWSFLDIFTLLILGRSFKFISKTSIFLIPVVGWAMFLKGDIPLRRMDNRSQLECLKRCMELLKKGASVFFFPEGTRSKDGKMGTFKKGAFSVAAKTRVPVVPITLMGTGKLMPTGMEATISTGPVKVMVHKPIEGSNADELCNEARNIIAEELVTHGYGVH